MPCWAVHLSGNNRKNAAFRKRPKLQSVATSQWERKPGSVLTTHLRTSVWEIKGTVSQVRPPRPLVPYSGKMFPKSQREHVKLFKNGGCAERGGARL